MGNPQPFCHPRDFTPQAEAVLRALTHARAAGRNPPPHWFTTLRDAPREGAIRPEIERLGPLTLKETIFA